jgi:hypothetical protein
MAVIVVLIADPLVDENPSFDSQNNTPSLPESEQLIKDVHFGRVA